MSMWAWARPPVPMNPMPIRSLAPRVFWVRMVRPGKSDAAPAVPRKSRRLVAATSFWSDRVCRSRIVVLLRKRKYRQAFPRIEGDAGARRWLHQVGFKDDSAWSALVGTATSRSLFGACPVALGNVPCP